MHATEGYNAEVLKLATSQVSLNEKQAQAIFIASGLSDAELDAAVQAAVFSAAEQKATASTLGFGTAAKGLWSTMKAHPFMSITTAVGIVIGAYSSWKQH